MSPFFHKSHDTLALIIDIQSSVVRGTLIFCHATDLPHIAWTSDISIPFRPQEGGAYLVDSAVKAIGTIASSAHTFIRDTQAHPTLQLPSHIGKVHCVLSSPWIVSQARSVYQKMEKETRITRSFVKNIIQKERRTMISSDSEMMVAIEEKIFDVRLNGYSIVEWENNKSDTFEVSFAISLAGKSTISRFTEECKKAGVTTTHIDFHSSLLLQHIAIDSTSLTVDPHILIHVHGELTDIVISTGETCILFGSHPMGVRTIIRQLAEKRSISTSEADSMVTLLEAKQLDPIHSTVDANALSEIVNIWIKKSTEIISLAPKTYQPLNIIISSRFHETLFKTAISSAYPSIKTDTLSSEHLYSLATFASQAEKLRLTILYMEAIHRLETF